ncbi:MAG TPA: LysR family transcriptional regulator [Alphaproteobacteria bacterium]|nr:LysR family transcriptional regulator [Alphaproteobacteria bacterium]
MYQIRYFLAVAQTLNFTRAAEECHVSQPALTRAIHLLEDEFGGRLLTRERTLSHLTDLGKRMLPLMRQCYDSALSAKTLAREVAAGETASLSIAVSPTVDVGLLTATIGELSRACPCVQLKLNRGAKREIAELLKTGEVELVIAGPLGEGWERLDAWSLFTEPFELIVNRDHKLANQKTVDLDQLSGERFLVQAACEMVDEISLRLSMKGIAKTNAHEVTTHQDLIAMLEANLGVAIVPVSTRRSERLRSLPINGLDLTRTVAIYSVAGRRRSHVATTLLNLLRAADWTPYVN